MDIKVEYSCGGCGRRYKDKERAERCCSFIKRYLINGTPGAVFYVDGNSDVFIKRDSTGVVKNLDYTNMSQSVCVSFIKHMVRELAK